MANQDQERRDDLDGVLQEAFGPEDGETVLDAIERLHGATSSVLLRETLVDVAR